MAAKQRGGGSKKRLSQRQPSLDIRFHAQPPSLGGPINGNAPVSLTTTPDPIVIPTDNYMQARREFVFASLVGHRVAVTTRDGSIISGVFGLHGNSQILPAAWRSSPPDVSEPSPTPDSTFVYTARPPPADPEDDGWRVVKQKRRSAIRVRTEALEDTNSSVSSNSEAPPAFELLYVEHRATKPKPNSLWLRCAYRQASTTQRSSHVMDWLAIPWDDVAYISAIEVPDNPDELCSSRPRLGFQTDGEISQNTRGMAPERQLQRWDEEGVSQHDGDTSWPATIAEGTEEGPGSWDQFTVNEHKFGVKSTYVDGMYSTALNEDVIPVEYIRRADRLAEEMDQQRKSRVREGRYQYHSDESDEETEDEEARFSAVAGTGRYANPKQFLTRASRPPAAVPETASLYNRRSIGRGRHEPAGSQPQRPPPQQRPDLIKRQSSSHASNSSLQPSIPSNQEPRKLQETAPHAPPPNDSQDTAIRNVKDNINALNLEPIKSRKLSQRKEGAPILPTTTSSAQQAADQQERRVQKKAEFLKSLRMIESNLAKKGWDSATKGGPQPQTQAQQQPPQQQSTIPAVVPNGPPSTAEIASSFRTSDTTATPPSSRKPMPGERPSSAAVPEHRQIAPPTHVPAQQEAPVPFPPQWPVAPLVQTGSGTGDGLISEDVSSTADDSLMEKRFFQFNPNATTFTPKGNSQENERTAQPPTAPEVPKPPTTEQPGRTAPVGATVPAVKRSNIAFKPFDLVIADLRRRGKHSGDEAANVDDATEMSMVSHFYDIFVEAARDGVANQPPNQLPPDWDNKLTISYTDLLQATTQVMTAMPAPQTAAAPAFFAPTAPQTQQAIFFPSPGGAALNPSAPPFTHVTSPFFNLPLMRTAMLTQAGMAEPAPGTLQPAAAYHPIILPQQRWGAMPGQPDGQPWQVLQAAPAAYTPELFTAYGLVCPTRVPYQMPR